MEVPWGATGLFIIVSSAGSQKSLVLNVEGASLNDGARIVQSSTEHLVAQAWKLVLTSIFVFGQRGIRVKSPLTGLALDSAGGRSRTALPSSSLPIMVAPASSGSSSRSHRTSKG